MPAIAFSEVVWQNPRKRSGEKGYRTRMKVADLVIWQRQILVVPKNRKYQHFKIYLKHCDIIK
jgi:hypothetical protein